MSGSAMEYQHGMQPILAKVLAFQHFFEQMQQDIDFRHPRTAQQDLSAQSDALLGALPAALAALMVPAAQLAAHRQLGALVELWARAVARLLAGSGPDFGLAFIESRRLWCEGLALAYGLREDYPALAACWLSEARRTNPPMRPSPPTAVPPVGVMQEAANGSHAAYALYVPEDYTPTRPWPLIVCLHGAYGHGHEYLWTWLRVAHSEGCIVLAPKSRGPTWSLLDPPQDIDSVCAMLDEVAARYAIDGRRCLLSGLSDGGSFAYLLGLSCPSRFTAVAPIAGVLHPTADRLLRAKQGMDLPLHVVHGARDFIFDVRAVRSHCGLLEKLGYQLTYTELPEWGHAYTDGINERLVWPWFAALPG